jgi:hypothetical protein
MSPKVVRRVRKLQKLVARGTQYLVLTAPKGTHPRPRRPKHS